MIFGNVFLKPYVSRTSRFDNSYGLTNSTSQITVWSLSFFICERLEKKRWNIDLAFVSLFSFDRRTVETIIDRETWMTMTALATSHCLLHFLKKNRRRPMLRFDSYLQIYPYLRRHRLNQFPDRRRCHHRQLRVLEQSHDQQHQHH